MTQPSQVFPPWLTPSVSVATNAAGVPVATSTSIVFLPLTYFGPSIPLGSLFTFGGSTSPASTSTPLTTTATSAITTTTTSATPTSTTSISTSTSATSISSSSTTSSLSSTTSFSASSLTSSTSPTAASSTSSSAAQLSALTKGQLVGVIVASILGLIFLFVLALFLYLWCKGRKNRRQLDTLVPPDEDGDFDVLSPGDVEGYRVAGDVLSAPEGYRVPGEGSPRHSGDEASSFLRRSRGEGPSFAETSAAGAAASAAMSQIPTDMAVSQAIPRIPLPTTNSDSSRSSNSHASGFGVLIDRPNNGHGFLSTMPEHPQPTGATLSDADMQRLEQENVLPDDPDMYEDGEYTGAYAYASDSLLAPPRLLDPGHSPVHPDFHSHMTDLSEAEVLRAELRNMGSLVGDRRPLPESPQHMPRSSSSLLGAIGLSLANLGRRSWFRGQESQRQSPDFTIEPYIESDVEMGQAMLSPENIVGGRRRGVGTAPDGSRPRSTASIRTGTSTVYHDAHSSVPGTPLFPPLPTAATPVTAPGDQPVAEPFSLSNPISGIPVYDDEDTTVSPDLTDTLNLAPGSDILDMPAPSALPHFASVSSLKETATGSSLGLKLASFPPGLDTVRPVGWSDVATEVTACSPEGSTFGDVFSNSLNSNGRVTIDLLEEAPPDAELGWRSIASAGFGDAGRRGTFGLIIDHTGVTSEQGSLHSMRSHFNPSVRSTGSAAASRRDPSTGSASSFRPSAHSLARTGSISSDGRRRHPTTVSPTLSLSAFGLSQLRPSPLSNGGSTSSRPSQLDDHQQQHSLLPVTIIGSPPCAHVSPDKMSTIRSFGFTSGSPGSVARTGGVVRNGSMSGLSAMSVPWAAGLDNDWVPAA